MPWNRWRTYDFGHFVAEARRYGFDMWGDDDSDDTGDDDSFPSFTFEHALFGPASGVAQFRQIAQISSYRRRRTPPASERRRTLLAGAGGGVPFFRGGRFRVSRAGEARRVTYREAAAAAAAKAHIPIARELERARREAFKHRLFMCGVWAIFLTCLASLAWGVWRRRSFCETRWQRALLLVQALVVSYIQERAELGRPIFEHYLAAPEGTKTTWVLAILFAIYGCFSALFLLGLVLLTVALERLVSRPGLRHLDDWVLITHIIGFAVGHWWQGRLVEGVGLMALFFGGFWLADAKK